MLLDQVRFARQRRLVDFQIVRLHDDAIGGQQVAVLHLADVSDDDIFDWNLSYDILSDNIELLIEFDFRLQAAKLPLLGPIVEGRDEHDDDHGDDDSSTFDPFDVGLLCR